VMHAGCIPVLIIKIKRMASLTPVEKRRISTKRKSWYKKEREEKKRGEGAQGRPQFLGLAHSGANEMMSGYRGLNLAHGSFTEVAVFCDVGCVGGRNPPQ
jgi:hypothetical protein